MYPLLRCAGSLVQNKGQDARTYGQRGRGTWASSVGQLATSSMDIEFWNCRKKGHKKFHCPERGGNGGTSRDAQAHEATLNEFASGNA